MTSGMMLLAARSTSPIWRRLREPTLRRLNRDLEHAPTDVRLLQQPSRSRRRGAAPNSGASSPAVMAAAIITRSWKACAASGAPAPSSVIFLLRGYGLGSKQEFPHAALHLRFGVDADPQQVNITGGQPIGSGHGPAATARCRRRHENLPIKPRLPDGTRSGIRQIAHDDPFLVGRQRHAHPPVGHRLKALQMSGIQVAASLAVGVYLTAVSIGMPFQWVTTTPGLKLRIRQRPCHLGDHVLRHSLIRSERLKHSSI